jgi:hypothetical protein
MASGDDDILEEALEVFKECEDNEDENRRDAEDDLRFARLGEQWLTTDRKAREDEGRPCLTINKLPAFIRQVVNDARQNSPSITVRPVDSQADIETADIMSGLIRDIESQSSADIAYDTAIDYAATMGFGYWRFNLAYVDDNAFEQDIRFERISNPFSIYGDPNSDAPDSSDWDVAFRAGSHEAHDLREEIQGRRSRSLDKPKVERRRDAVARRRIHHLRGILDPREDQEADHPAFQWRDRRGRGLRKAESPIRQPRRDGQRAVRAMCPRTKSRSA